MKLDIQSACALALVLTFAVAADGAAQYDANAGMHPLYVQLGAGESVPQGGFDKNFQTGWNAVASLGWQRMDRVLGLRVDAVYDRFAGRTVGYEGVSYKYDYAAHYAGTAELTARFPIGSSTYRPAFYLVGGGGVHYLKTYGYGSGPSSAPSISSPSTSTSSSYTPPSTPTTPTTPTTPNAPTGSGGYGPTGSSSSSQQYSSARAGINGGAGWSFGMGRTDLFIESRFITVFTQDKNTNFVPVVFGITRH